MARRAMQQATLLILTALASGSQHGYGIIGDVTRISSGRVRLGAGTLHAALDRLRRDGLIEVDREEVVESRLRRYCRLTAAGSRDLATESARLQSDARAALSRLGGRAGVSQATSAPDLQRAYRRWLRCYPRSCLREHESEMVGVLMAGARPGRRRPAPAECLDLVASALWLRVRLSVPRSDRAIHAAIQVMCLGAAVELATVVSVAANRHTLLGGPATPTALGDLMAVGFWLWIACCIGRRRRWVPTVFTAFVALNLASLAGGLVHGAPAAEAASGVALCLFVMSAAALILRLKWTSA